MNRAIYLPPQVVQSLRNEIEDFITGEDYKLTKHVFFMLKLPFDIEADTSNGNFNMKNTSLVSS